MTENSLWKALADVPPLKLGHLEMLRFRNHVHSILDATARFNLVSGSNGSGKTTVLEAIHYLCVGRGFVAGQDQTYTMHGCEAEGFLLKGHFVARDIPVRMECRYKGGEGKTLIFNEKPYERLSDHLGRLPAVAFYPGDIELVWGFAGERRRYLDQIFSFINPSYLEALKVYYKALEQRNALLRQAREKSSTPDGMLMEVYEEDMLRSSEILLSFRDEAVRLLNPLLGSLYRTLARNHENTDLAWQPSSNNTGQLKEAWTKEWNRDIRFASTLYGPHRDDYPFLLNGLPLKKNASQGQQKTFILSLKLGISLLISQKLGLKPILLFDDIFDKLDEDRIRALMEILAESGCQIFLTDTSRSRLRPLAENTDLRIFECSNGSVHLYSAQS